MTTLIIFVFCLIGCAISSWHIGKQRGVEDAISYLVAQGYITLDEEEDGEGK